MDISNCQEVWDNLLDLDLLSRSCITKQLEKSSKSLDCKSADLYVVSFSTNHNQCWERWNILCIHKLQIIRLAFSVSLPKYFLDGRMSASKACWRASEVSVSIAFRNADLLCLSLWQSFSGNKVRATLPVRFCWFDCPPNLNTCSIPAAATWWLRHPFAVINHIWGHRFSYTSTCITGNWTDITAPNKHSTFRVNLSWPYKWLAQSLLEVQGYCPNTSFSTTVF